MHFFLLFTLLLPAVSLAQIVTSSFDRTVLSINPAAATSRGYAQVAIGYKVNTSDSVITSQRANEKAFKWNEKIQVDRKEAYFTGGHSRLVPELYLSQNQGKREIGRKHENRNVSNNLSLFNNLFNLGAKMTSRLSLGVTFYAPSFNFSQENEYKYPDGKKSKITSKSKTSLMGIGMGYRYALSQRFYIGGYYTKVNYKNDFEYMMKDTGMPESSNEGSYDEGLKKFGFGIAYLAGSSRGHGFRWELAYNHMDGTRNPALGQDDTKNGQQVQTSFDFAWRGISFGANVKMTRNGYYETLDTLESFLSETNYDDKYLPSYGWFIAFNSSKGHTLSLSGMIMSQGGKKTFLNEEDQDYSTKLKSMTLGYAYLF